MGTLRLGGDGPEDLEVQLTEGQDLIDAIRLEAGPANPDGLAEGTEIPWPAGTTAWLLFRGRSTAVRSDLDVDDAYLRIDMDSGLVQQVPRQAKARLWIKYPDSTPFVFAAGDVVWS